MGIIERIQQATGAANVDVRASVTADWFATFTAGGRGRIAMRKALEAAQFEVDGMEFHPGNRWNVYLNDTTPTTADILADITEQAMEMTWNADTPTPPATPLVLTGEQRAILERAAVLPVNPDEWYHYTTMSDDRELCMGLVALGLLWKYPWTDTAFRITDAGHAAIASQPGDALPDSMGAEGGDVLPDDEPMTWETTLESIRFDADGLLNPMTCDVELYHSINEKTRLVRDEFLARERGYAAVVAERDALRDGLDKARAELRTMRTAYEQERDALLKERQSWGKGPNKTVYLKQGIVSGFNLTLMVLDKVDE